MSVNTKGLLLFLFVHCTLYTVHCAELLLTSDGKLLSSPHRSAPYAGALRTIHLASDSPQNTVRRILDSLGYHEQEWFESGDTLRVVPGVRFRIKKIEIEGVPEELAIPAGIMSPLPIFYDAGVVRRMMRDISRFFSESGYPYNKVSAYVDVCDSACFALRFIVDADERVCNGAVVIKGVKKRPQMYLRDVRLVPERFYSCADVDETIRRLSMRPYVRHAGAASPVIIEEAPLCGDEFRRAVTVISIIERVGMDVEGVLGYESAQRGRQSSLSGRLNLSFMNLLRLGEAADVSYTGTNTFQRLRAGASRPWVFGLPLEMGGAGELEVEDNGYGFLGGEFWTAAEINARFRAGIALRGSETVPPDSVEPAYKFYGADLFLSLIAQPWEMGRIAREFSVKTGSGFADREKYVSRSRMELAVGGHRPFFTKYALAIRVCGQTLFTDEQYLSPAETYRVGGHGSLRGYSEEEFAFRSTLFSQTEAILYFNRSSSVFIFFDSGAGFERPGRLALNEGKKMLGYGAGMRFPSRLGTVSLEWARNAHDGTGLGRVHAGIRTRQ